MRQRSRILQPGFFQNERLAELSPLTRLLFAGLWTIADREGRFEDRPKRIKAVLLPYDNCDVDRALEELAAGPDAFICRYEVDGNKFAQILTWHRHQSIHHKEEESGIPSMDHACVKHGSSMAQACVNHDSGFEKSESCFLVEVEVEEEVKVKVEKEAEVKRDSFDEFWEHYPKKVAKGAAKSAYDLAAKKLRKRPEVTDVHAYMLVAVKEFADSPVGQGEFCPHPATWLNQARFDDDRQEWQDRPRGSPNGRAPKAKSDEIADATIAKFLNRHKADNQLQLEYTDGYQRDDRRLCENDPARLQPPA